MSFQNYSNEVLQRRSRRRAAKPFETGRLARRRDRAIRRSRSPHAAAAGIITKSMLRVDGSSIQKNSGNERPMKKWRCVVCDFIYDEAQGIPDEGIPPGTRWEDVPESWTCPECGASKDDFVMEEMD